MLSLRTRATLGDHTATQGYPPSRGQYLERSLSSRSASYQMALRRKRGKERKMEKKKEEKK
jgi:hypothetical protein